jgi:ketosteroid isomerase-like protein
VAVSPDNSNPPGRTPEDRLAERPDEKRPDEARLSGRSSERSNNDQIVASSEVEDFFQRLPGSFHWPKPNAEAVAAAVEAIQRMSGSAAAENLAAAAVSADDGGEAGATCAGCGRSLPAAARFCVWCGLPAQPAVSDATAPSRATAGQHHVHHHYHHFVDGRGTSTGAPTPESEPSVARGRAPGRVPGSLGTSTGGRAEAAARQVVQDWAQACNTKHIDDLIELYAAEATLIRSSVPPVRSLPAIREFLVSLLEAGLGDVEMESLRVDIALDLGRCKMLVPVAMGKRREERGKYLVVLVRQPAGTWKILADCWSSDMAVSQPPAPDPATRHGGDPVPPVRKTR